MLLGSLDRQFQCICCVRSSQSCQVLLYKPTCVGMYSVLGRAAASAGWSGGMGLVACRGPSAYGQHTKDP